MSSLNRVDLIGNLGSDPEGRTTQSGQPLTTFSLATNEAWTDRDGGRQERTEWHRIVVWGPQGEACARYLRKGSKAFISGRLSTRTWEDNDGQTRSATEVVAQKVVFLDQRGSNEGGGQRQQHQRRHEQRQERPPEPPATDDFNDDDIPF